MKVIILCCFSAMGNESFPTNLILDVLTDGHLEKKVGYIMNQLGEHREYL